MEYIKGKFKQMIYEGNNGYKIALFKIKDTNQETMTDYINKTITITGYFATINQDSYYILNGEYIHNNKYGNQYQVSNYEKEEPKGKDAIIEFLTSKLVKGCGEKTAISIVETLGDNAINLIKEDYQNLLKVSGISEIKAKRIYSSIVKNNNTDDMIIELKKIGFSINDSLLIIDKYGDKSLEIIKDNIYNLIGLIEFSKIDNIFLENNKADSKNRLQACITEVFKRLGFKNGDTYLYENEIVNSLKNEFNIYCEEEEVHKLINDKIENKEIVAEEDKLFLSEMYESELSISKSLYNIYKLGNEKISKIEDLISGLEKEYDVKYNVDQKKAIKNALSNRISIITGGPGTGKTTIINIIVKLYIRIKKLDYHNILNEIALLAPTGRAAKKISSSTGLPAMTIHRFLKWNKEKDEFQINEFNKNPQKLIIVDETSMIDTNLFDSLLKGLKSDIKLILVGDENQLPSVGPGLILNDIINSNIFTHTKLERIYRQSANSYIPLLAKEIKDKKINENFTDQKDDYNFLNISSDYIKDTIKKICFMCKEKNLDENDIQVLAPMYKGMNGIDNLNVILRDIFNPSDEDKKELKYGDIIYRENDKVLQLVNDPDNNVFNGDIGYIESIDTIYEPNKKEIVTIDFDGQRIEYSREDLNNIKHAYVISIHKAQGSEFPHVIIPVSKNYHKMLYNKLIYTGVSRAKKSLIIIGEVESFIMAINNDYSNQRKTNLKNQLMNIINKTAHNK